MLADRAFGFAKAGEEAIIPTSPVDLAQREIENKHPHGRFGRLRKLWAKVTGKDPLGLPEEAKLAFSRLDGGRKLLKRGLLSRMHLNDLRELSRQAVAVPKAMQLQTGRGPIVSRAASWRRMTEQGGRFDQAGDALRKQVVNHVPMPQPSGQRVVTFKDKRG